jgi:hypothetical protein
MTMSVLAAIGLIVVLHVVPLDFIPFYGMNSVFDLMHVLGFAFVAFIAVRQVRVRGHWPQGSAAPYLIAIGATLAVALLAESLQLFTSRDAELMDLFRDACGVAGGSLLSLARPLEPFRRRVLGIGVAIACLALGAMAPLSRLAVQSAARLKFPEIAGFETALDLAAARPVRSVIREVAAPDNWPHAGRVALVSTDDAARYAGVTFTEFASDWSGYDRLELTLASASDETLAFTLRIDDDFGPTRFNERYNRQFDIGPEPVVLSIPLMEIANGPATRTMNMRRITDVMVFLRDEGGGSFYLDAVGLR